MWEIAQPGFNVLEEDSSLLKSLEVATDLLKRLKIQHSISAATTVFRPEARTMNIVLNNFKSPASMPDAGEVKMERGDQFVGFRQRKGALG